MPVETTHMSDLVCSQCATPLTGGLDTYSTPLCYACFFGEQQPDDERIQNLRKEDVAKLGEMVQCVRCNGTGEGKNGICCYRCHGRKYLTAVICDTCNGTGEVEHECDCKLCYADHADCQDCIHGLAYVPFRGKPQQVNNPEKLRDFWVL